jgi:hypothetical protein
MTFNEATWCAEIAAEPTGKVTDALSMKGLTSLLSTPKDYWVSPFPSTQLTTYTYIKPLF